MPGFTCPSCGAELHFRSSVSVYAVCEYCGSMVLRSGLSVEAIGEMASLPDDISPVQVGTVLTHANRRYTVMGRVRMSWGDGAWTEWFMDDGAGQGWLVEAQGFFSVAFEHPLPPSLVAAPWPVLGTELTLDDIVFRVSDLKQATCIGSEGELPFAAPSGRVVRYADLTSHSGAFASLEEDDAGRRLSVGENVRFDELHFENPRPVEGWTPPDPGAQIAGDPEYPPLP